MVQTTWMKQRKQNIELIKIAKEQIYSKLFLQRRSGIAAFTPGKSQTEKNTNTPVLESPELLL